jgi:hypothetical protein
MDFCPLILFQCDCFLSVLAELNPFLLHRFLCLSIQWSDGADLELDGTAPPGAGLVEGPVVVVLQGNSMIRLMISQTRCVFQGLLRRVHPPKTKFVRHI